MLYHALTARENLRFFARLHGIATDLRVVELLERMGLGARGDEPIGAFSRGMIQRLAIARALLHDPEILLLDEPLSHLDEPSCRTVLEVLMDLRARGRVIVLVAHQLAEVIELATSVAFLAGGRLAAVEPRGTRSAAAVSDRFRGMVALG
jgi:heme exporter protein A